MCVRTEPSNLRRENDGLHKCGWKPQLMVLSARGAPGTWAQHGSELRLLRRSLPVFPGRNLKEQKLKKCFVVATWP